MAGRFHWKNQHPNQSAIKVRTKNIFEISRKSVFEVSPKEMSQIPHDTQRLPSRRRGQTAVAINRFTIQKTFGKHISYQAQI
jgi:hypothetical protein